MTRAGHVTGATYMLRGAPGLCLGLGWAGTSPWIMIASLIFRLCQFSSLSNIFTFPIEHECLLSLRCSFTADTVPLFESGSYWSLQCSNDGSSGT